MELSQRIKLPKRRRFTKAMELCYHKTFIDVNEEVSVALAQSARSQSAPKRVVLNDAVDVPALEHQYKDKQMGRWLCYSRDPS